jgi:hypothetical protein
MAISVSLRDKLRHSSLRRKISLVLLTALFVWVAIGKAGKSDSYPIDYLWIAASFLGVMSGVKASVIPVGWEKVLFWISVTSTCVIFAWLFLESFKREDSERRSPAFFGLLGAVQIGYVLIAPFFFQRYFLPVIPMIILYFSVLIRGNRLARNPMVLSFLIIPALFSVLSTKDSLSWNQAKWHAAQGLIKQGISAKHIEAGIEWDGWNWYEYSKKHPDEKPKRYYPVPWWLFDLTPVIDPVYVLSFSELEKYKLFNLQEYYSPFFQKEQALLILLKSPPKVVEGFETDKNFTTGWNHNLESIVLSRNQKTDFVSEGRSSLKCEFKTSAKDTFHYAGMRVKTPMETPGFIFDIWIDNPEEIKKVFVYCYDNGGNLTGKWSRDVVEVPIKRRELNTFFFLFGLSQDSFQFGGGSGGRTDYVDVFMESERENTTIVFYIDNFRT